MMSKILLKKKKHGSWIKPDHYKHCCSVCETILMHTRREIREILFRAKRVDNGEWVYGGYWLNSTATRDTANIIDSDGNTHGVIPETIGQYIGCTQKNGAKIFEGDIVLAGYGQHKCVVAWDEECARFIYHVTDKPCIIVCTSMYNKDNQSVLSVIGNIHDNPELIKVK